MPSRKKDRGKQRKAAKQNRDVHAGRASPMGALRPEIKELMAQGGRLVWRDNGTSSISHPCFKHIKRGNGSDTARAVRDFDRGLLSDEERQELAENYVHNFGQDVREGGCHGTEVIMRNLADPHLRRQLGDELVKADIHTSMLRFLDQSHRSVSDVLGRVVDADKSIKRPLSWVAILGILVSCDGLSEDTLENTRLTVAKNIGPLVMRMTDDDKRALFQSKVVWHTGICLFFDLVRGLMMSKDGFLAMISYEGFLPFVAQVSCWSQSREDIATESKRYRQLYPDASGALSSTSHESQKVLAAFIHEHDGAVQESVMRGALDQIACTPLLSNDPNCSDSTLVGLVRMLDKSSGRDYLFECIIEPLLVEHGYVDAGVIAELIEYGRSNTSEEAAETVLNLMVAILGRCNDYEHIKMIDSRYAAAVQYGLLEFCIDAVVAYGDGSDCVIAEWTYCISYGLHLMAMHSRTSRALREKKAQIMAALDVLRNQSTASGSNAICTLINNAVAASSCATCCNCLKDVDRNELLYCKRCGVECYCSPACQSESYALGHERPCKEFAKRSARLREEGLSETELKRMAVLSNNLMVNGCQLVQSRAAEFLIEEWDFMEATIDLANAHRRSKCP